MLYDASMPSIPPLPLSASGAEAVEVARRCAEAARRVIVAGYGRTAVLEFKARRSVVTAVDVAAERAVLEVLAAEYPGMSVLAEETAAQTAPQGWTWVVDPLDGTRNFSRAIPHFAFSIALCWDGEPSVGLTEHPLLGHQVLAVRGRGASLNGSSCHVADCESLGEAVVALDLGFGDEAGRAQLGLAQHLWKHVQAIRISGSAALGFAYVASGRWDAFVHRDLAPWDLAAGVVLVREAGGRVTTLSGSEPTLASRALVAATPSIHSTLLDLVDSSGR